MLSPVWICGRNIRHGDDGRGNSRVQTLACSRAFRNDSVGVKCFQLRQDALAYIGIKAQVLIAYFESGQGLQRSLYRALECLGRQAVRQRLMHYKDAAAVHVDNDGRHRQQYE